MEKVTDVQDMLSAGKFTSLDNVSSGITQLS